MKYNIPDKKLRMIIDELGEEYKDLLVERILDDMDEIDIELVNPSDLIRLDVATKASLKNNKREQKRKRLLTLTSLLGIIYALLGVCIMLMSEIQTGMLDEKIEMASIVVSVFGLFVALFSMVFGTLLKGRTHQYRTKLYQISPYEIVNKWKEIEALIVTLFSNNKDIMTLSSMVAELQNMSILTKEETDTVKQLMRLRNMVVHKKDNEIVFSQTEMRTIISQADNVIGKLEKLA